MALKPFEWKDRPALIEHIFPAGKISIESYKEQNARQGKTLTGLGSFWKGRKPLVLNKACILASLLPATDDPIADLEVFELLMGMDEESMLKRIQAKLPANRAKESFEIIKLPFRNQIESSRRAEEINEYDLYNHIWKTINNHLGTDAKSFSSLVEQIGVARFGHIPRVADVFCGSGQIPFEAARVGCEVYASDLNPIACLLTWGAFHIIGANKIERREMEDARKELIRKVTKEISDIDVERNVNGWRPKFYLYCTEVKCPETGWIVPVLASRIISKDWNVVLDFIPDTINKKYDINVKYLTKNDTIDKYNEGTYKSGVITHSPDGIREYKFKISTIRGDYRVNGEIRNKLREWGKTDFIPKPDDVFQERLYCILWIKNSNENGQRLQSRFASVTKDDIEYENKVIEYVREHIIEWQEKGYIPDMMIEHGYNTDQPIRERGWRYWHHLFNPRQLLISSIVNKYSNAYCKNMLTSILNWNSRLSPWNRAQIGGGGNVQNTFYNQALNTLYDYGCRSCEFALVFCDMDFCSYPLSSKIILESSQAKDLKIDNDIYITDPPYGDAVKYEEITEFFIAWLRKNPPKEFANWIWDSRRSLAIKGEDEGFRQGMIEAYSVMRKHMPDNGIQVLMFTHQSGSIWADMANIIWASGFRVSAAWCVTTENDSGLRQGANIKSTVLLVLRKRLGEAETYRDDLGEEIAEAVEEQVEALTGLDQRVREKRSEGLYADSDLQMAGYAAALKVLTSYSRIDGRDMVAEAKAAKKTSGKGLVEELINFAEQTAVQYLVPSGFSKEEWKKLLPIERFYLKMAELEARGEKSLDNYQRFAKAFKVQHYELAMSKAARANAARLKLASEFKGTYMSAGSAEIADTPLRALLYAAWELEKDDNADVDDVVAHLMDNCPDYHANRSLLVKIAGRLASLRESLKDTKTFTPKAEAEALRVLAEALGSQKV